MINQTLLWLLALPICIGITIWVLRFSIRDSWVYAGAYTIGALLLTGGIFFVSTSSQTSDTEIWNGQVKSKDRIHDDYVRRYECNCTTQTHRNKDGSTYQTKSCQTCTEDHYTVEWRVISTIGTFQIEKLDETSRRVYKTPDPDRYKIVQNGDPVSKAVSYVNYVQAVPNSLFSPASDKLKKQFAQLLPPYPDRVYDHYMIDRFITPGWAPADVKEWNKDISMGLREIGSKKEVNLIVVIAKTNDPNYEYALTDHWGGVNKNDVVLLIGSTQYPKIDFVRVISWTKNELFKVELRDSVMAQGVIDRRIVPLALNQIDKNFERRKMVEFAYLDGEIDPPEWLVWLLIILVSGAGIFVWWKTPEFAGRNRPGFNTYRGR